MAGGVCDVSKESIHHIVAKQGAGNAAVIVVGGAAESLDARPGSYTLTLKNRKGFARLALQTGWVVLLLLRKVWGLLLMSKLV